MKKHCPRLIRMFTGTVCINISTDIDTGLFMANSIPMVEDNHGDTEAQRQKGRLATDFYATP